MLVVGLSEQNIGSVGVRVLGKVESKTLLQRSLLGCAAECRRGGEGTGAGDGSNSQDEKLGNGRHCRLFGSVLERIRCVREVMMTTTTKPTTTTTNKTRCFNTSFRRIPLAFLNDDRIWLAFGPFFPCFLEKKRRRGDGRGLPRTSKANVANRRDQQVDKETKWQRKGICTDKHTDKNYGHSVKESLKNDGV